MEKAFWGLATGIGSFPYTDAREALDLIFSHIPLVPHWPQLPAANEKEGLVRQYLAPLLQRGLVEQPTGKPPRFAPPSVEWLEKAAAFLQCTEEHPADELVMGFKFPLEAAAGFYAFLDYLQTSVGSVSCLKGQLTGPLTSGIVVTDGNGQPAFYQDELLEIIVRSLCLHTRWQARILQQFQLPVLLFVDEPGLYAYGQAGFPQLSKKKIQESLLKMIKTAHQEGIALGVHACAGIDWSILFELPFDVINIDVYHYFDSLLPHMKAFAAYLERGGALAFGIVPTSAEAEQETAPKLLKRLDTYLKQLISSGADADLLRKQFMLTPSCGTGTLTDAQTRSVYRLLSEISAAF